MGTLRVDRAEGVVTVALNRPEWDNAVDVRMADELLAVLASVERAPSDRVLVLTGTGGSFCSGADLSEPLAAEGAAMRRIARLALALHRLSKPTITSLNGPAAGFGAHLALAADLVIAARSASLRRIFAQRALLLDSAGGCLLPRLVGARQAEELAFRADPITAEQAFELGLCLTVVPDRELVRTTHDWARRLAGASPRALAWARTTLGACSGAQGEKLLERELVARLVNGGGRVRHVLRGLRPRRSVRLRGS